jgi:phospholipid/cholesterol/gamma-HCH transport system substrate-binding protein
VKPNTSFVLVGLFVLLLSTALVAAVLWLTTGGPPKDYDFYITYMTESVSGLSIDAPVKYKGVNVGRVREIGLNPENPEEVRVKMVVLEGTPVKLDTVAELSTQGLTGLMHINLTGGSRDSGALVPTGGRDYAVIPSRESLFGRLDDSATDLFSAMIEATNRINRVLSDENLVAATNIMGNTDELTRRLVERVDEVESMLEDIRTLIASVQSTSDELPDLVSQFNNTAGALETMAVSLSEAGETLRATSLDLNQTVASSGKDLRRFTSSALPEATRTVVELRDTAMSLRRISESIEADPSQLVFGGRDHEPGPGE